MFYLLIFCEIFLIKSCNLFFNEWIDKEEIFYRVKVSKK